MGNRWWEPDELECEEIGWRVAGAILRENSPAKWMREYAIKARCDAAGYRDVKVKRPKGMVVGREYKRIEDGPGL